MNYCCRSQADGFGCDWGAGMNTPTGRGLPAFSSGHGCNLVNKCARNDVADSGNSGV